MKFRTKTKVAEVILFTKENIEEVKEFIGLESEYQDKYGGILIIFSQKRDNKSMLYQKIIAAGSYIAKYSNGELDFLTKEKLDKEFEMIEEEQKRMYILMNRTTMQMCQAAFSLDQIKKNFNVLDYYVEVWEEGCEFAVETLFYDDIEDEWSTEVCEFAIETLFDDDIEDAWSTEMPEELLEENKIDKFKGEYDFLSNFYEGTLFKYKSWSFSNGEAAFHSQKNVKYANHYQTLRPKAAKEAGRQVDLRSDWEEVKEQIMYEIQFAKFTQDEELKKKLLATNGATLIEGNWWHDNYWGSCQCNKCKGEGRNKLGEILMRVRDELKK